VRIFFLNANLLRVQIGPVKLYSAPEVAERARAIAGVLAEGEYDLAAFSEVFDEPERAVLRSAGDWRTATGPSSVLGPPPAKGSGLYTLSRRPIVTTGTHRYSDSGSRVHDVDAWARKGVLMVAIEDLEIYSTHLFAGGDLVGASSPPTPIRMAQVEELLGVILRWHQPGNAALVVGDFNIAAGTPTGDWLLERMSGAGFEDLWRSHGKGDGLTSDLRSDAGPSRRIDYAFFRASDGIDCVGVDCLASPRLSDHAALVVELTS
jgi:endonuclease/exonuclease/phosphatase family metal-dependent hydrolase